MLSAQKKELFFGCIVGALCVFLWHNYVGIIRNVSFSRCDNIPMKLDENVEQTSSPETSLNHESTEKDVQASKSQVILHRNNCTTAEYNAENVKAVNNKVLINGPWPYNESSEVCDGDNSKKCLPALIENHDMQIFTAKTSKTGFCISRKSASRISISLSCMLDDPLKFFYGHKDLINNALERFCASSNQYNSVKEAQENGVTSENGWKLAMIVRDPLERFVSGFIYLCINGNADAECEHYCNGCGVDISCFLDRQSKKFQDMIEKKKSVDYGTGHFYPQNWACGLRDHLANYTFLNYRTDSAKFFDEELGPFFQSQNVSDQALSYIRDRMTSTRTKHANTTPELATFLQNKIRSSPKMLEKFLRVFYHDYTTFKFPFPELIK